MLLPVRDDRSLEELLAPPVHLGGYLLGNLHENRIAIDRELQIAVVVEGHRSDLAQGIFAVEHPAVGTGQQCIRHIADAFFHRRVRTGCRAGPLNPLTLKIPRDFTAFEVARARILNFDLRSANRRVGVQEGYALLVARPRVSSFDASPHQRLAFLIQRGQGFQRRQGFVCVHIGIIALQISSNLQRPRCHPLPPYLSNNQGP